MDGVLVIDKPQGLTSHDVVAAARRLLRERRIGHTGTLDPLATGVLPLVCGRATRLVRFFISSDKDYEAMVRFGLSTDSYDITGEATSHSGGVPSPAAIEAALAPLRGEYLQTPPAFSAKKVAGERAYARVRRNEPVNLVSVPVRVTRADLLDCTGASARIALTCSTGFYVRSFAHALGELVGTGACLESLRRTRSGEFSLDRAVDLEQVRQSSALFAERWISLDRLLPHFPSIRLDDEARRRVGHGQILALARLATGGHGEDRHSSEWFRLVDAEDRLIALGTADETGEFLHPAVVLI